MSTETERLTLPDFLKKYPWQPDETDGKKPMDFLWSFDLAVPCRDLWPLIIDTSTFNKLLGLPQMRYEEREGVLYGESKNAGVLSKWREVPWEWEFERGLNNARVYSQGFATYVRTRYMLEPLGSGTRLYVYFGWVPRSWPYRALLAAAMPGLKADYAKALKKIERILQERQALAERQRALFELADSEKRDPALHALLERRTQDAVKKGGSKDEIERLAQIIEKAPEEEIVRIRLKKIARENALSIDQVLPAALYAARSGILSLSWDVTCPHCRGVRKEVSSLGDIPTEERCDACDITFSSQDYGNLEVVFHVNPEIRQVAKKFYCAAEPATKTHIYVQRHLAPKTKYLLDAVFDPGEYRARFASSKKYEPFSITQSEIPRLEFENSRESADTLVIERREEDNDALRPHELFGLQVFRDLFGDQILSHDLKVELGIQNILFTDIVGSTALYVKNGDGEAFRSVTRHFQKIFEIVRLAGGAVVKTIGDSAMVTFHDATKCIEAAIALQRAFNGSPETGAVLLRISIHSGPCLAVNLNNGVDYFGNTVNYAAKLQQHAGAHQIAMSSDFLHRAGVEAKLHEQKLESTVVSFAPSWAEKPLDVHVIEIAS